MKTIFITGGFGTIDSLFANLVYKQIKEDHKSALPGQSQQKSPPDSKPSELKLFDVQTTALAVISNISVAGIVYSFITTS